MAHLCPSLPLRSAMGAGEHAELDLLATLERGLSDAYTLFHSVDWSRGAGPTEQHGEIDIVVVNQAGEVLLMEVKSGSVDFSAGGIFKSYGHESKNVRAQVGLQYGALRARLNNAGLPVRLHHLLVLPDLQVQSETVQWPRERMVDSNELPRIVSRVTDLLGAGLLQADTLQRVLDFFQNRFRVALDVSALAGRLQQSSTRLSAGLATWVPRMTVPSGLVRVNGTAGSGKTQLALRLLRDAEAAGQTAAYICFNRALADHMSRLTPVRTPALSFHEYSAQLVRHSGRVVDFSQPGTFEAIATQCLELLERTPPDLDMLVLDEMQDMQAEWVQAMLSRLKVSGKAFLLEDSDQQLYKDRVSFDLPEAVSITSHENFRTPRALVTLINLLGLTTRPIEALALHAGEMPDPITYTAPDKIGPCTIQAVERCLQRGFNVCDIAIVSLRGRERSLLQNQDQLGPWKLKHFTGRYDEGSGAIWTDGDLSIDSVRRFKGQAAPAVVLTECDIAQLDDMNRRLLFVGLTRAQMHLEWVMSAETSGMLERALMA
jgi:UvrD-like helicase C-terminal domain/AAA domain/Nuclease-related domain